MWYAVDLMTNEIHGPYDTEIAALMNHRNDPVDIQYRRFRGKKK